MENTFLAPQLPKPKIPMPQRRRPDIPEISAPQTPTPTGSSWLRFSGLLLRGLEFREDRENKKTTHTHTHTLRGGFLKMRVLHESLAGVSKQQTQHSESAAPLSRKNYWFLHIQEIVLDPGFNVQKNSRKPKQNYQFNGISSMEKKERVGYLR